MKDYYYILGIKQSSSTEEIKNAYKKLSLKFHPDINNGDEFFTERFKEIQEAYEVLYSSSKRKTYDELKNSKSTNNSNNSGTNFNPYIEFFKTNKYEFEFDEDVTFSWKTINADKVILKPFGIVPPIGQKTYKIKDFKKEKLTFDLIAENSNIERLTKSSLTIKNKTYTELYNHFNQIIETNKKNQNTQSNYTESNYTQQKTKEKEAQEENRKSEEEKKNTDIFIWCVITLIVLSILIANMS